MGVIFPCMDCGAADSRDAAHAQGCPTLAPLSQDALIRIARRCERGWAEAGHRRAELEQQEARTAHVAELRRAGARARLAYRALREGRRAKGAA
jgi:hypothetical protein